MSDSSKKDALPREAPQSDQCSGGDTPVSGTDVAGLIHRTLELFQQRSTQRITQEDSRQIIDNATGFFRILLEWESAKSEGTDEEESTNGDKHRLHWTLGFCNVLSEITER